MRAEKSTCVIAGTVDRGTLSRSMPHSPAASGGTGRRRSLEHVGDQQHVRAVAVELEPFADVLAQHGRRERTERLAELDLQVHHRLHLGRPRVAKNRAAAERARSELHAALHQADDLFARQARRHLVGQLRAIDPSSHVAVVGDDLRDLGFAVLRAQIRPAHPVGVFRNC